MAAPLFFRCSTCLIPWQQRLLPSAALLRPPMPLRTPTSHDPVDPRCRTNSPDVRATRPTPADPASPRVRRSSAGRTLLLLADHSVPSSLQHPDRTRHVAGPDTS